LSSVCVCVGSSEPAYSWGYLLGRNKADMRKSAVLYIE
jgi:hypothetical protein